MELVCNHLCGWAALGTRENYREHTITMGQEEPGTTKPRQSTEPRVARTRVCMWVLLSVPGQRGASFSSQARKSEHRYLFPFSREDACEIKRPRNPGLSDFFLLGDS